MCFDVGGSHLEPQRPRRWRGPLRCEESLAVQRPRIDVALSVFRQVLECGDEATRKHRFGTGGRFVAFVSGGAFESGDCTRFTGFVSALQDAGARS